MENNPPKSLSKAMLTLQCPRCRGGKMFIGTPYSRGQFTMHEKCTNCGFKFEREPGFFWGGLFVNYALVTAISLVMLVIFYLLDWLGNIWVLLLIPLLVLFLSPVIFQYSRVIYLYIMGGYRYFSK